LSQAVVFLQKGNAYQFDASLAPYPIGALVRSNDNLTTYQSTVPNNSNNPNSNMTGWRIYNSSGFIVDNLTTNDGTKALSAKQGKVIADGFTGTKTTNGYQKLYGGLIMQWGTVDYNSNPGEIAVDVVFPSVFPTSCLNVTATRKSLDNNFGDGVVGIVSYSSGSVRFQLNTWDPSGASSLRGFTWFAIGY